MTSSLSSTDYEIRLWEFVNSLSSKTICELKFDQKISLCTSVAHYCIVHGLAKTPRVAVATALYDFFQNDATGERFKHVATQRVLAEFYVVSQALISICYAKLKKDRNAAEKLAKTLDTTINNISN